MYKKFNLIILHIIFLLTSFSLKAEFFEDVSYLIKNNVERLSYGIAVSDVNKDGKFDFIVTGFNYPNLALTYENGLLINTKTGNIFSAENRNTISVAACDIDMDGFEEIYFLNTDTFSGIKSNTDILLDLNKNGKFIDLFKIKKNIIDINLTAGRSVACVDRNGDGKYGIYVSNYGGPSRYYEMQNNTIKDIAANINLNKTTGGRAIVSGHILSKKNDIFAGNERGANFLYKNINGNFKNVARSYGVEDFFLNARGTALSDILYRGRLDILVSNWQGVHKAYVLKKYKFINLLDPIYSRPSKARTLISADFDNDGYDEIFINNIGEVNRLFKILKNGIFEPIPIEIGAEAKGLGTGAAVADIDDDGILELIIGNGESKAQPLKLYKAKVLKNHKYIRIKPINIAGAPARGATVTLVSNLRSHSKTIDAGSGYLCQMEPIAHYGLRKNENNISVKVTWTNGSEDLIKVLELNKVITIQQKRLIQ